MPSCWRMAGGWSARRVMAHGAGVVLGRQQLLEPLGVSPLRLSLYARFQRALASGGTARVALLSAYRWRWRSIASGLAQGGGWPALRAQCACFRGIHLSHVPPDTWAILGLNQ